MQEHHGTSSKNLGREPLEAAHRQHTYPHTQLKERLVAFCKALSRLKNIMHCACNKRPRITTKPINCHSETMRCTVPGFGNKNKKSVTNSTLRPTAQETMIRPERFLLIRWPACLCGHWILVLFWCRQNLCLRCSTCLCQCSEASVKPPEMRHVVVTCGN